MTERAWKLIKEEHPQEMQRFLVYDPVVCHEVRMCQCIDGELVAIDGGGWDRVQPTHWMPLPQPPSN